MNFSDGDHTLLDIAERSGYSFTLIVQAAGLLREHGLVEPISENQAE
jgi:aminopeptidase-like protein